MFVIPSFLWLSRRTRPVGLTREGKDGYTENYGLSLYKANGDKLCLKMMLNQPCPQGSYK